jgi:hypothetical protein
MPDQAEVEETLAAAVARALYPLGAGVASAVGNVCRVYRGWPTSAALEADLAAGVVHVTIQPMPGSLQDTTRFSAEWQGIAPMPTLSVAVDGEAVAFSGLAAVGQVVGVLVDEATYAYRVRAGDTLGVVAAVLAALVRAERPTELQGNGFILPGGVGIVARVVTDGSGGTELRRQRVGFRVTAWCPDPGVRDRVAGCVDLVLAEVQFLDVGGWGCWLRVLGGSVVDEGSAAGVWRRDLLYSIEYPTVMPGLLPSMLFGVAVADGVSAIG